MDHGKAALVERWHVALWPMISISFALLADRVSTLQIIVLSGFVG